jgi:predicted tellurium resistance membrane protein TerC
VDKLPKGQQELARRLGLLMTMFMRIGLLLVLSWIIGLVEPLFTVLEKEISGRCLMAQLAALCRITRPSRC